ncbi:MAG: hypothetical protein Q7S44_01725 [bacterium]|nr:hypothetical protein [bacterium]
MYFDFAQYEGNFLLRNKQKGPACRQAGFVNLLIILVATLAAGFFYWGKSLLGLPQQNPPTSPQISTTPTPKVDEAVDWKTYNDEKYGFSAKYPPDWSVVDITNEEVGVDFTSDNKPVTKPLKQFLKENIYREEIDTIMDFVDPSVISKFSPIVPKKGPGEFWISGLRLEIKEGTEEDFEKYRQQLQEERDTFLQQDKVNKEEITDLLIGDIEVIKISSTHRLFWEVKNFSVAVWQKDGFLYKLTNDSPGLGHSNSYFDQILSTFKFLDEE